MNLYEVIINRPKPRTKNQDKFTKEFSINSEFYVAANISEVWSVLGRELADESVEVTCIKKHVPVLAILKPTGEESK